MCFKRLSGDFNAQWWLTSTRLKMLPQVRHLCVHGNPLWAEKPHLCSLPKGLSSSCLCNILSLLFQWLAEFYPSKQWTARSLGCSCVTCSSRPFVLKLSYLWQYQSPGEALGPLCLSHPFEDRIFAIFFVNFVFKELPVPSVSVYSKQKKNAFKPVYSLRSSSIPIFFYYYWALIKWLTL